MRSIPLVLAAIGCSGGSYCKDKIDCEGGIDIKAEACDQDLQDAHASAELQGCGDEYAAYQTCANSESTCESGAMVAGPACDKTENALAHCLDPYLTTDPNPTDTETVDLSTAQGWVGTQIYTRGESDVAGDYACELHFDTIGTRLDPTPVECVDCLLAFEISMIINPVLGFDEGPCAASGIDLMSDAVYGVRDNGLADSVWLVQNRYNNFYDAGFIRQTGAISITFDGGPLDELTGGYYVTDHWAGTATLNK